MSVAVVVMKCSSRIASVPSSARCPGWRYFRRQRQRHQVRRDGGFVLERMVHQWRVPDSTRLLLTQSPGHSQQDGSNKKVNRTDGLRYDRARTHAIITYFKALVERLTYYLSLRCQPWKALLSALRIIVWSEKKVRLSICPQSASTNPTKLFAATINKWLLSAQNTTLWLEYVAYRTRWLPAIFTLRHADTSYCCHGHTQLRIECELLYSNSSSVTFIFVTTFAAQQRRQNTFGQSKINR